MRALARWVAVAVALALTALRPSESAADERPAASSGRELGLDEVLSSVDRAYPLMKAAELERAIAGADLLSAEGGFDVSWKTKATVTPVGYYDSLRVESVLEKPTSLWGTSAFAGYRLGRGEFPIYDQKLETLEYGEVRAGLNVPLWRNGPTDRRRASLAKAELGRDIASLSVTEQRIQLRRAAAHRYWAWVAAGRRLSIARDLLRNVESRDSGLATRVERGDLPPIERADNARAIEQRRAQVAMAERGLEQAAIELGLFVRDSDGKATVLGPERLPDGGFAEPGTSPASGEDFARALAARPEAQRFQLQERQSRIELDWAKNQLAPGIDLQLAGSQDVGRSLARRADLQYPVLEVTLLLDVPIQTRAMQGRRDAAAAAASRSALQQTYARDRIEADVRDAQSALRRARERIDATRREVRLAVDLERAERTRFEQGDSHLLIVNIREQQTAEAELREVESLLDYYRAVADLQAARGG